MRKSELKVGMEVAITAGTADYDQRSDRAVCARVEEVGVTYKVPRSFYRPGSDERKDGVRVRWLEGATDLYFSYVIGTAPGTKRKGTTGIVPARCVWMQWADLLELRRQNIAAAQSRKAAAADAKAKQGRLEGRARRFGVKVASIDDSRVHLSHEQFGELLSRLEGGA